MFLSRGEERGMGEDLCTSCSSTSWLDTERRLRLVAGLSPSLLMDSVSELRRIGDKILAPSDDRSGNTGTVSLVLIITTIIIYIPIDIIYSHF